MCGRFTVTTKDTKKIADRFQVELEKALERASSGGEAPAPTKERAKKDGPGDGAVQRRSDSGDPRQSAPRPTPSRPPRASGKRG